jgi:GNAT superfamily N-acetyltransferase
MIRRATLADRDCVIELLAASRRGAGFDDLQGVTGFVFPFRADYAERMFLAHLRDRWALCLVHDVAGRAEGVLMAIASEHLFGPVWLARETVWFIDPAHRGGSTAVRMLEAYEAWAAGIGCRFAGMAGMGEDPAVAALYQRRGYSGAEVHYLKPLQVKS